MTDFRLAVRQDALNKILSARQDKAENVYHSIRYNIIPLLNFEAEDFTDMILWESTDVSITVPPVLRNVSHEELFDKLSLPDNTVPEWSFTAFPCQTVADRLYFLGKISIKTPICDNFARKWRFRFVKPSYMWVVGWLGSASGGALGADTSTWWALGSTASVAYEGEQRASFVLNLRPISSPRGGISVPSRISIWHFEA
ncbi:hypothetical protein AVEN_154408-1 [Araneus ventricosus]|uniref:Uncharacterized protein n=1 Tax=Araneus ventricosus TaxID=182803 RepID=A0A4Y2KFD6_ARAVE|nr:hypothetical protein AVEN_154408-1 [Araneus ventricosus]